MFALLASALAILCFSYLASPNPQPSLVDSLSLLMIGASVSPVLGTLTSSYASNTVSQIALFALLVHLFASDGLHSKTTSPVSFNAAFAGILLLSSRLESSALSFSGTVFSTLLLVVLPKSCGENNVWFVLIVLWLLAECGVGMWFGQRFALVLFLVLAFVGHVAPRLMFDKMHWDKLHGAWDLLRLDHAASEDE
ncbi:hypothetical protein BASA81_008060 [Batrachochytrium salamandrivorans]|nr:hypothetical protein BASA81_008060 [Batrachochytrium salamandrivorans]